MGDLGGMSLGVKVFLSHTSQDAGYFIFMTIWVILPPLGEGTLAKKSQIPHPGIIPLILAKPHFIGSVQR